MKNNPTINTILDVINSNQKQAINTWLANIVSQKKLLVEVLNDDFRRPVILLAIPNVAYCGTTEHYEEMLEIVNDINLRYHGVKAVISRIGVVSITYRITYCGCNNDLNKQVERGIKALTLVFDEVQKAKK